MMGQTKLIVCLLALLLASENNAQESPAYYVPNFTPNVTYRTDFCKLHEAVEQGDIELRNALDGVAITVGFSSYQLNAETDTIDEENPSIVFEFMDELSKRSGLQYRQTYGKVDGPGPNNTWSDVLFYATDVYDVAGDYWTESTSRLEQNIIYPDGWYDGSFVMVQQFGKSPNGHFDFASFTAPFTAGLWGLIILTTIISGIVYYVLDYFDSRIKGRTMDMGLESSLFFTAFLMGGNYVHQPKSRSTRILVFSMAFFFFIVLACYTANLASFLVLKNRQVVVDDIQDVIRNDLTICVERDTPAVQYLRSFRLQPSQIFLTLSTGNIAFEGAALLALLEGKCDVVLTLKGSFDKLKNRKEYNPNCDLALVGRVEKTLRAGLALKASEQYCTSLARDVLHLHMLEMKESGKYDEIWERALNKTSTNSCGADSGSSGKADLSVDMGMGVANMSGMFAVHAAAILLSLLITLFDFYRQPKRKKEAMISELRNGMLGTTTLNRAVASATDNGSSVLAVGKNDQTGANKASSVRTAVSDRPGPGMLESDDPLDHDSDQCREVKKTADVKKLNEDGKTEDEALMDQIQEKQRLIELLRQKIQEMDERDQRMDERDQKMDERDQEMEIRIQKIEAKR